MYSKTFTTQFNKFSKWCNENDITVQTPEKVSVNFKDLNITDFQEPSKMKIKAFLKHIYSLNYYFVQKDFTVTDYDGLFELFQNPKLYSEKLLKIDNTLETDTMEFEYCEPIPYYTDTIISAFGNPQISEDFEDIYTYEWKICLNGKAVSIFDWKEDNTDDLNNEEKNWYLSYNKESQEDLKILFNHLDSFTDGTIETCSDSSELSKKMEELLLDA